MDILGTAAKFPLQPNGRGGLAVVSGVDAVENSLIAIISSGRGEHPFEPLVGWPISLFMVISDTDLVQELIKEAIIDWEDRIVPATLDVQARITDEGILTISVIYQVHGDATMRTLQTGYRSLA